MSHNVLIVCTYTAGTPYEAEARQLAETAARFGYPMRGIAVPDQGDWWRNVGIKPSYVLEMMEAHPGPLLVLDADCLILEPLDELFAMLERCDLAVKFRPGNCLSALFNAAVLLIRKTPATHLVVKTWAQRGRDFAHLHRFSEQGAFAEGMLWAQRELRFAPLAEKFHMFPDRSHGGAPAGCAILHNKTSNKVRSTALPSCAPQQACRLAADVHVVCIGPQATGQALAGMPMSGIPGANQDFAEYASRYGITKFWSIAVAGTAHDPHRLEHAKVLAIRKMFAQFPLNARVLLADHDTVFLRNPQRIADTLDTAELALAWRDHGTQVLPRGELIALKLTESIRDSFLIELERTHAQLLQHDAAGDTFELALYETLHRLQGTIHTARLPAEAVADLGIATQETVALSVRGTPRFVQGDSKWPTLCTPGHAPQALVSPV